MIDVILLVSSKLGKFGDVVSVSAGYARNYLIPRLMAVRATLQEMEFFEKRRAHLQIASLQKESLAHRVIEGIKGMSLRIIRAAGDDDTLYGSVSTADIAAEINRKLEEAGDDETSSSNPVTAEHVILPHKIKKISTSQVLICLYPGIETTITVIVARTAAQNDTASATTASSTTGSVYTGEGRISKIQDQDSRYKRPRH